MFSDSTASSPAVTLIVAYHNAQHTIGDTIRSIINQTAAAEIELIMVDDGSDDDSQMVVNTTLDLANALNRLGKIQLLTHLKCKGVAAATATGLLAARGEWVMRCDADDLIESDGIEKMLIAARNYSDRGADVVWCGYVEAVGERRTVVMPHQSSDPLNNIPIDTVHFSLCNKLIRREILLENGILPFENVNCWEDLGIVARLLTLNPDIVYIDSAPYIYNRYQDIKSLSRSSNIRLLHDHIECAEQLETWFRLRNISQRYEPFLTRVKFCAKVKYMRGSTRSVAAWKATFPEVNSRILSIKGVALHYRIMFAIVAILPSRFTQWISDQISRIC